MKPDTFLPLSLALSLAACMVCLNSSQISAASNSIIIDNPWARPTIGHMASSAAYLTVRNAGASDKMLTDVRSEAADRVEVHTHKHDKGTVMMAPADMPLKIPAKSEVTFQSGGLHIMIMGARKKLSEGDTIPITLVFANEEKVTVNFRIKKPEFK